MYQWLMRHRRLPISLVYSVVFALSIITAYLLRFEYAIPKDEYRNLLIGVQAAVVIKMLVFRLARLDRGWFRHAGLNEIPRIAMTNFVASITFAAVMHFVLAPGFPRSIFGIDLLVTLLTTSIVRFSVRIYKELVVRDAGTEGLKSILIYGADDAGMTLLREVNSNPNLGYRVIGFLDDDPKKRGEVYNGVRVLAVGRHAARVVDHYSGSATPVHEIIIALPSASGAQMLEVFANCRAAGVPCKMIPSVGELLTGKVLTSQIREVSVVDLLGRATVDLDETALAKWIRGKTVLVTGAGGSIGSELCRQIARHRPRQIVGLDHAETALYQIDLEMKESFPSVEFVPQVANICDPSRLDRVFRRFGINCVFHAAAYKHVPMMEAHPLEAIKNNVIGTFNLVEAARLHEVESFLMISSDKAVNPTNVMGATKRAAELIVTSVPRVSDHCNTRFVSVRFGNVLNSNGSVIPLFKAQIAAGGPVTVTHPEIQRYFMTIPEAAQLVLQASTMGRGSEIFVLDMGEPVKIFDLAKNMIRLSGKEREIEVRFTGLRPGEKLYEELITAGDNIQTTYHPKIRIFSGRRLSRPDAEAWIRRVEEALEEEDELGAVQLLKDLAPEYQPSEQWTPVRALTAASSA